MMLIEAGIAFVLYLRTLWRYANAVIIIINILIFIKILSTLGSKDLKG